MLCDVASDLSKVILEFTVKQKRTLLLLSLFLNDQSGLSPLSPVLVLFNVKLGG